MTDRRYELLPGTEAPSQEPFHLGNAATSFLPQFAHGAAEGALGLVNMMRPGTFRPGINVFGDLPQPGRPNMPAPEPTNAAGRVGRGVGNAAPYVGLLAPMAGPAAGLEAGIGLLGAMAGETAREYGAGGFGQLMADLSMSMTPGLLAKSAVGSGVMTVKQTAARAAKAKKAAARKAYQRRVDEEPMLATHQLTTKNLRHADEIGGLPAPSLGVVNPYDNGMQDATFGDVTLVGTRDMVDPADTFVHPSDAYTVRYPEDEIRYKYTDKQNYVRAKMWGDQILDDPNIPPDVIGMATPIKTVKDGELVDNLTARILFYKEKGWPLPSFGDADHPLAFRDKMMRVTPGQHDYREYLAFRKEFGKKHKLEQQAMIPNAKGRPMPVTLNRLTSRMKRKPKDIPGSEDESGLAHGYGVGGIRAHAAKPFKDFDEMDRARGHLSFADKEGYFQKTEDALYNAKGMLGNEGYTQPAAEAAIARYAKTGTKIKSKNGKGAISPENQKGIDDLLELLQEGHAPYFEAKPMRPVKLEEFKAALVSKYDTSGAAELLKKRGVKVLKYGTAQDKAQKLADQHDLFFQYLAALAGGGAAVGAASKAVQSEEPPQLLRPF